MTRHLLIVESPAKCQKIRSFLGPDWTVLATMGHLRALEESLDAIGLPNRFQTPPAYHWLKEKAKAIQQLKDAKKEDTHVYLASDDDREGEMIAYSVCVLLRLPPRQTPRIVFHEITEKAIRHALDHPRTLDINRVRAQEVRAILDLLIGFTISPLLWKHVAPSLSAGRCQTPALRLVVERERAIATFQTSRSWVLTAQWSPSASATPLLLTQMADALEDEDSAQEVLRHAKEHPHGTLTNTITRPWTESAPAPLITSTLQQQASLHYHFSPKQTMCMAQRLYEAGHITYMRTDHAVMAEEAKEEARSYIRSTLGEAYVSSASTPSVPKPSRRPKAASVSLEGAQQAHEAIRPTHLSVTTLSPTEWGPSERRLYELISRRALQSVMTPAHGTITTLTILLDELEDFPWVSEEKTTVFDGWKRLGRVISLEEEPEDETENKQEHQEALSPGARLRWIQMEAAEKETAPPGRYTEASLVRELERHGIGRPSTFASLLAVLQDKGYAHIQDLPATPISLTRYTLLPLQWPPVSHTHPTLCGAEKKKLVPTPLGLSVWEWLEKHLEDLFAYPFTASMERALDHIASGKEASGKEASGKEASGKEASGKEASGKEVKDHDPALRLLQTTWDSYRERYETLSKAPKESHDEKVGDVSSLKKTFRDGIKAVQTKKGPLLLQEGATKEATVFFGWPKGVSWGAMTEQLARDHIFASHLGIKDDLPLTKKTGPYGPYVEWGSIRVPYLEGEPLEDTCTRLEKKKSDSSSSSSSSSSVIKETPHYMVRTGPYGPYLLKKATKTKAKTLFVSIPKGLEVAPLTDKDLAALYQAGCEAKQEKKAKKKKPATGKKKGDVE